MTTITYSEIQKTIRYSTGVRIENLEFLTTYDGVTIMLVDSNDKMGFNNCITFTLNGKNLHMVFIERKQLVHFMNRLGWRKSDLIRNISGCYIIMHEIGHAKRGLSESAADNYACGETADSIPAVVSQIYCWAGFNENSDKDEMATYFINWCGMLSDNDCHMTAWRRSCIPYIKTFLKEKVEKRNH